MHSFFDKHVHAHQVEVHVRTINGLSEIERLVDRGVDGVATDFPGWMRGWLDHRG